MHNIEIQFLNVLEQYSIHASQEVPLLLAISGGKDSMALLHVAYVTLPKSAYIAVYINHGIRPESTSDGDFIRVWCEERDIVFVEQLLHLDLSDMGNLESRAREARYTTLREVMSTRHASCIVTAHHQTDQAETIMMRWLSGSSLTGLTGMQVFSGGTLRPFLSLSQNEILAYVRDNTIEWREDSTNHDESYQRNWLRNKILPQVREKYPSLDRKLVEFADYARDVSEYLDDQVSSFLQENHFQEDRGFNSVSFQEQHRALRNSIISYLYSQAHQ